MKTESRIIIILSLIHLVGIIGYLSPIKDSFKLLTPFSIIAMVFLVIYSQPNKSLQTYITFFIIILCGYLIEVLGVSTSKIFGTYQYGETLGWKVLNVPPIIGFNWLLLIIASGEAMKQFNFNIIIKAFSGALLLVLLDLLIEPVAINYNFWKWENNRIPFQNYLAWYIVSVVLIAFYLKMIPKQKNLNAQLLYVFQFIFFLILNLFLS